MPDLFSGKDWKHDNKLQTEKKNLWKKQNKFFSSYTNWQLQ